MIRTKASREIGRDDIHYTTETDIIADDYSLGLYLNKNAKSALSDDSHLLQKYKFCKKDTITLHLYHNICSLFSIIGIPKCLFHVYNYFTLK